MTEDNINILLKSLGAKTIGDFNRLMYEHLSNFREGWTTNVGDFEGFLRAKLDAKLLLEKASIKT